MPMRTAPSWSRLRVNPFKSVVFPARYAGTIAVGGVTDKGAVYCAYTSDDVNFVDVWAPADPVRVATSVRKTDGKRGFSDKYISEDGTSYATAHVAAAAAMWLTHHYESLDDAYPEPWQRIEAFRKIIRETGTPTSGEYQPPEDTKILDIEAVLKAALPSASALDKQFNVPKRPDPPTPPEDRR